MSNLIYKWVLGKTIGKVHVGGTHEDPYFEEIPPEELGIFRKQGAKRKKPVPPGLSANDAKILKSVRNRAYQLDLSLTCCCGIQLGWAGIIGLVPWIGDFVAAYFAVLLVRKARGIDGGLPQYMEAQMMGNIMFDFLIGLIPVVGDLVNIAYKANTRNCVLLEEHLKRKLPKKEDHPMSALGGLTNLIHGTRDLPNEGDGGVRAQTNSEAYQQV